MVNLKGLWHCKPSPSVREWVASFEEAVKRGLVDLKSTASSFTTEVAEHTHPELEALIRSVETKAHTHPELLREISALRGMVLDIKDTVDKIKAL